MTTHNCGYQIGDKVIVDIGGWDIPGVIVSMSPYALRINLGGDKHSISPEQVRHAV
ncbi:hypothetical protein [Halobaculum limi]|uniref:hypothetical protein n=1 Tax=Halobaculum limi TaxID=3031916 RepID=UPI0024073115|nr:hypothetical protein [Halobaculum sp. YSMS11]